MCCGRGRGVRSLRLFPSHYSRCGVTVTNAFQRCLLQYCYKSDHITLSSHVSLYSIFCFSAPPPYCLTTALWTLSLSLRPYTSPFQSSSCHISSSSCIGFLKICSMVVDTNLFQKSSQASFLFYIKLWGIFWKFSLMGRKGKQRLGNWFNRFENVIFSLLWKWILIYMKYYNIREFQKSVPVQGCFRRSQLWYLKLQLLYSRSINTAGFRMMKTFDLFEPSVELKVDFSYLF